MQQMQTSEKWIAIQKKYKDDKEKLAQEQMKLYQELGINPFASCLPTLIQLPIIFGLYQAITSALAVSPLSLLTFSTHLYPFIDAANLIPLNSHFLWMNLSQPERLNVFGIGIPILTILVVITTFLQQKLMMPATATPGANDQSAQMTKMMNIYMPLFMGYIALTLASGLALYFVASNLVGIGQYAALGKLNWRNLLPKKADADNKAVKPKTVK
jgi:YidC/Oxa1 family membrane protein insertase